MTDQKKHSTTRSICIVVHLTDIDRLWDRYELLKIYIVVVTFRVYVDGINQLRSQPNDYIDVFLTIYAEIVLEMVRALSRHSGTAANNVLGVVFGKVQFLEPVHHEFVRCK